MNISYIRAESVKSHGIVYLVKSGTPPFTGDISGNITSIYGSAEHTEISITTSTSGQIVSINSIITPSDSGKGLDINNIKIKIDVDGDKVAQAKDYSLTIDGKTIPFSGAVVVTYGNKKTYTFNLGRLLKK